MLLVGIWWWENKNKLEKDVFFVLSQVWDKEKILSPHKESNLNNKLVEWKVPIGGMGINDANLKDKFLSNSFVVFQTAQMWGKFANCHMLFRTVREIKVSSDWFGCILVISL